MDVWIVAGQSNAVGNNGHDGQNITEGDVGPPGKVLTFSPPGSAHPHTWADASDNIHVGVHGWGVKRSVGPGLPFAKTLVQLGGLDSVGLVPTAQCGSNLYQQWKPNDGPYYTHMINEVHAAMAAAPEGSKLCGMIWVHGEADAMREAGMKRAETYGERTLEFIRELRKALSKYHNCLPIIMVVMSELGRSSIFPFIHTVRQQQAALHVENLLKVDMQGFEFFSESGAKFGQPELGHQQVHLSKSGCRALGTTLALFWMAEVARAAGANAATKVQDEKLAAAVARGDVVSIGVASTC